MKLPKDHPKVGVIEIDHLPTGKRYHIATGDVRKSYADTLTALKSGTALKALQKLYNVEDDFKVKVVATDNVRDAKKLVKALQADLPSHLKIT